MRFFYEFRKGYIDKAFDLKSYILIIFLHIMRRDLAII